MIELAGAYSSSDLVRFQYFHFNRRRWWISALALLFPLFGISGAIILMLLVDDNNSSLMQNALPFIGCLLLWAVLLLGGPYFNARRQFRNTPFLQEPIEFRFNDEGAHMKGPTFTTDVRWSHLKDIYETKSNFLVYLSPQLAWVVPKHLFVGEAEIERTRRFFIAHLPNAMAFHQQNLLSSLF